MWGKKKGQLLHVAAVIGICMGLMQGASTGSSHEEPFDTLGFFFPRDEFPTMDVSNITWVHAVNSRQELNDALAGDKHMIEADILMGSLNDSSMIIPVMAHPPADTSDLSFEEFLTIVLRKIRKNDAKKGIKLDFKNIDAVEPCLKLLKKQQDDINFPVWLNADVLLGPIDSTKTPLDGEKFLKLAKKYYKAGTLSLGWTTRFGDDDGVSQGDRKMIKKGEYKSDHIKQMISLGHSFNLEKPTFPVRASMAAKSTKALMNLLVSFRGSTLTLFSPKDDILYINIQRLRNMVDEVGRANIYMDLPFDMYDDSQFAPSSPSNSISNNSSSSDSTDDSKIDPTDNSSPSTSHGDLVRGHGLQVVVLMMGLFTLNYYN